MKLHFRGIEVPALGSSRDIVYRDYLIHEAKVEAKKHQLLFLNTLGSPFITDDSARRAWDKQAKETFDQYVMLLLGQDSIPENREEALMKEYYSKVVQKSKPKMHRDKDGKLFVTDLPAGINLK